VDGGTRLFWSLIVVLLGASVFFGVNAERRRSSLQRHETALQTGDIVRLVRVIDGDTLLVTPGGGETVAVRILGIKSFAAGSKTDPMAIIGQRAVENLQRTLDNEPVRVMVHNPPKDKHGRALASLFVADHDIAIVLVQRGLALVYTVYPFASMPLYIEEQETARAKGAGLWSDPALARRADLLIAQWRSEAR
jgi:endonuclease YncB( thermonuclease family)